MRFRSKTLSLGTLAAGLTLAGPTVAHAHHEVDLDGSADHVLLLSIDGLHALDLARYVQTHPRGALAELARHGVNFTNARLPGNSDSFPGLLALVTGGSPASTGIFYDVSYDRTFFAPGNTSCTGVPGTTVTFDETIDRYGADHVSLDVIDPATLPRRLDSAGRCVPVYPHDALRTNTIFEVVREAGGRTAWADKHPAYDLVNGPSGRGVDDLYTPEITNADGADATVSVVCTALNDQKKVRAVVNEIRGRSHDGGVAAPTPTLFGMNFQAVSVGQKLTKENYDGSCAAAKGGPLEGLPGGYEDGSGAPGQVLSWALDSTDASVGELIAALKKQRLYEKTLVVVTAKHGQAPINPTKVNKVGHLADLVATLPDASTNPAAQAIAAAGSCSAAGCGLIQDDDVAFLWLGDQNQTATVAAYLNANAKALSIEEVLAGDELQLRFNDPRRDSRSPDIIVQPTYGTIYTASKKKLAEHGGFSFGDVNVALLVSKPGLRAGTFKAGVSAAQVAPSILRVLGLEPEDLEAVRKEETPPLPGLGLR